MFGFCPLASGSKGNCIYIGTKEAKVLIDVGISSKQIEKRLAEINVELASIDAVIITHEHMDHVQGLNAICKKRQIPIFANRLTAQALIQTLKLEPRFKIFSSMEKFSFKDIEITPFCIQHDTLDPVGLIVKAANQKIGISISFVLTSSIHAFSGKSRFTALSLSQTPGFVDLQGRLI